MRTLTLEAQAPDQTPLAIERLIALSAEIRFWEQFFFNYFTNSLLAIPSVCEVPPFLLRSGQKAAPGGMEQKFPPLLEK